MKSTSIVLFLLAAVLAGPAAGATTSYSNLVAGSAWYSGQAGHEVIDDIHGTASGTLSTIKFRYTDLTGLSAPGPGGGGPASAPASLDAMVTVYDNPGGYDVGLVPVGGPYVVSGLPYGSGRTATVTIPGGPEVGANLWVGIQFSSPATGLQIAETPTVGSSHDFYLQDGNFLYFGGSPKANFAIEVGVDVNQIGVPPGTAARALTLSPAFPNPFRARTLLHYSLPEAGPVEATVYDLRGAEVRRLEAGAQPAGDHVLSWDGLLDGGGRAGTGIYFVRVRTEAGSATRKVILTR